MLESNRFTDNIYSLSVVKTLLVAYFTSLKIVTNTLTFYASVLVPFSLYDLPL